MIDMLCSWNPAAPGQSVFAACGCIPGPVKLRQANQGDFEFAAERGIGRADARDSAVGCSWSQEKPTAEFLASARPMPRSAANSKCPWLAWRSFTGPGMHPHAAKTDCPGAAGFQLQSMSITTKQWRR